MFGGCSLDRSVAPRGLPQATELCTRALVTNRVDPPEAGEGPVALPVDGVDSGEEEFGNGLGGTATGRGAPSRFAEVMLDDSVLALKFVGRLRDARVVVAVVEPGAVALRDGEDVIEEAATTSSLAAKRRLREPSAEERDETTPDNGSARGRLLGPKNVANLAEDGDVLPKLVAELGSDRGRGQELRDLFEDRPHTVFCVATPTALATSRRRS